VQGRVAGVVAVVDERDALGSVCGRQLLEESFEDFWAVLVMHTIKRWG
jgi:hypothetical protein